MALLSLTVSDYFKKTCSISGFSQKYFLNLVSHEFCSFQKFVLEEFNILCFILNILESVFFPCVSFGRFYTCYVIPISDMLS